MYHIKSYFNYISVNCDDSLGVRPVEHLIMYSLLLISCGIRSRMVLDSLLVLLRRPSAMR